MTPVQIEVLLHYYVSPNPHPRKCTSAVDDATSWLKNNGLIELGHESGVYKTTSRGDALVSMLCSTPFPACAWIDPRTKEEVVLR